jgi:hypothetical protein
MDEYEALVGSIDSLESRVSALESLATGPAYQSVAPQDGVDAQELIRFDVRNKRYDKGEYQEHIWFDCTFTAVGLVRSARAVKGALEFCDLFGAPQFLIGYTLTERLDPGASVNMQGIGFDFNQFMPSHQWMLGTRLEDMTVRFRVDQILYQGDPT